LRLDALEDPVRKAMLEQSVTRVSHVVSQLRDLAELELVPAVGEWFDLNAVATATIESGAAAIYDTGHSVELQSARRPVRILGRRVLIELALRNLIDNAIRHSPAGTHVRITVGEDGTIVVEDNGPGFGPAMLKLARERFASTKRSDEIGHMGLGLSIVERICAVHGGHLEIASAPGGGARCCLRLGAPARAADGEEFRPFPIGENAGD